MVNNAWGAGGAKDNRRRDSFKFLRDNPAFAEMPATMSEFLGPDYLDLDPLQNPTLPRNVGIRPKVREALIEIFGDSINVAEISKRRRAMFTGGIGIGKTTMASISLAYMVHWVLCLKDPQGFFGLLPGSRIAFMLMSTKDTQAKEVLFGDIKARINVSPWFKKQHLLAPWGTKHTTAFDPTLKNQLRFPKDIWVLPGNSAETTFEGYNILGGILDEGDSHKVTEEKDYAEAGYDTIHSRIGSRFINPKTDDHRGLLIVIGQMKKADGFMARKKKQMLEDKYAFVIDIPIWESIGWENYRKDKSGRVEVFYYDINRRKVIPAGPALEVRSPSILKIPMAYYKDFDADPVKALRDHAGIPPAVEDPFIAATDRIDTAQEKWDEHYKDIYKPLYVVNSSCSKPDFHPDFKNRDSFRRSLHVDVGYASQGDAMGMAMGHIPYLVELDGEYKPFIVIDFVLRIRAGGGAELKLRDFRNIIYELRDDYKFKISLVSYDGFQSLDSLQTLREKKFNAAELSVDRSKGPYEDLREAIYERRIAIPRYMTYLTRTDTEKVNVIKKELTELTDTGRKIDHPPKTGSKDTSDALAGVVNVLMGNSHFRRGSMKKSAQMEEGLDIDEAVGGGIPEESTKAIDSFLNPTSTKLASIPKAIKGLPPIERDPWNFLSIGKKEKRW